MKQEETVLNPGAVLITCKPGRSVLAVEWHAPETKPSASPALRIKAPYIVWSLRMYSLAAATSAYSA